MHEGTRLVGKGLVNLAERTVVVDVVVVDASAEVPAFFRALALDFRTEVDVVGAGAEVVARILLGPLEHIWAAGNREPAHTAGQPLFVLDSREVAAECPILLDLSPQASASMHLAHEHQIDLVVAHMV